MLALALLVAGCGTSEPRRPPPEEPRRGGTLRVSQEEAARLDPTCVDDAYESTVINQIYEGLVQLDPETGVRPSLAESWVISQDGRVYRFTLQPGVRFHDGEPLTAAAVVRSLSRALDPRRGTPCLAETYLRRVEGAAPFEQGRAARVAGFSAPDARTVEIRLSERLSFFLSVLAMDQLKIIPPKATGESLERDPIGTGPFRFVSRRGREVLVLARYEEYWGDPALLDTLEFVASTHVSPRARVAQLLRGDLHVIALPRMQRALLEEGAGYPIRRCPEIAVTFVGLNTRMPPLDRLEVRQAMAMAVARSELVPPQSKDQELATGILPLAWPATRPIPRSFPTTRRGRARCWRERARMRDAGSPD